MAASAQLTVATGVTATKLVPIGGSDFVSGSNTFLFTNEGTVDVLLGGEDVTTANGSRGLKVGRSLVLDVAEDLYAVVAGATPGAVDVLRTK